MVGGGSMLEGGRGDTDPSAPHPPQGYFSACLCLGNSERKKKNPFTAYCSLWGKYNFPIKGTWNNFLKIFLALLSLILYLHDTRGRTYRDKIQEGMGKHTPAPVKAPVLLTDLKYFNLSVRVLGFQTAGRLWSVSKPLHYFHYQNKYPHCLQLP